MTPELVERLNKLKPGSLPVIVEWDDAGGSNADGWHSMEEFEEDVHRYPVRSVGFVLRCTMSYLYLCSDYESENEQIHSVNSIPVGCITKLIPLREKK